MALTQYPDVEIASFRMMEVGGMWGEEKLSQKAPGNQMATSVLYLTHTIIKDCCSCLWVIGLEVWGHKELENCSQLQLNQGYF